MAKNAMDQQRKPIIAVFLRPLFFSLREALALCNGFHHHDIPVGGAELLGD